MAGKKLPDEGKILRTFGPAVYEEHKARNPDRVDGTCRWFLRDPKYVAWEMSNMPGLLWVSADPGCGKSVLSKSLIDNELTTTKTRTTCYFFFKDDNIDQQTATQALCGLLHQLFSQKPNLLGYASAEFMKNGESLAQLFNALWHILTKAVKDLSAGEVICVLDALDECEESGRFNLINNLNRLYYDNDVWRTKTRSKFLVTSRPYFDIERRFK